MTDKYNQEGRPVAPLSDPRVRHRIRAQLQATFAHVEKQPIPDDHVDLILALRRKERDRLREARGEG